MTKKSRISRRSFLKKTALLNLALVLDACGGGTITSDAQNTSGTGSSGSSGTGSSGSSGTNTPSSLSYSLNPATYAVNQAIAANTPSYSGGTPSSYSVSPALPVGLSLNTATGVINGTPTMATAAANYVVTAANSAGSATATISITVNSVASTNTMYDGVIRVGTGANSNRFVNGAGNVIQLRGGNFSGLETTPAHFWSPGNPWGDDGGTPQWAAYAAWKPNIARIPLNVAAWLKLTCQATAGANGSPDWSGTDLDLDPQNNYKQFVYDAVASLQAIGCYVIFDLHWGAPKFTFASGTKYLLPAGQSAFADYDTAIPFWQSMAQTFGTQATPPTSSYGTINNNGIMFELFNEPYLNQNGYTLTDAAGGGNPITADEALKNGGWSSAFINHSQGGTNFVINQNWRMAGYQQMLDTIRATGAQNVCIVNGNYWTQDLTAYQTYKPTDSLNQIAFGWHPYPQYSTNPHGNYPYTTSPYQYPSCGAYQFGAGGASPAAVTPADNILAAGYPVICTEDGGYGGTNATSGEPHMAFVQNWADSSGASYIFWQWNNTRPYGTTDADNYLTAYAADGTTILPIQGSGQVTHDWMVNHS